MSAHQPHGAAATRAPARPATIPIGPRPGGPLGGMAGPPQKSLNFGPSARRLLGRLRPERTGVIAVVTLTIAGIVLNVLGPRILGHATDLIFSGAMGSRLPAGLTKDQALEQLRARGEDQLADMLGGMDVVPGQGIDFSALRWVLAGVLALYVGAALFMWVQGYLLAGIVQRSMYRLRSDVEEKLHRLPLRYFDRTQRGDVLSRVTNDIDNIGQSLQQTLSQLLTSVLTVIGVLTMMVIISPLLAVVAIITVPLSIIATTMIAKRSQPQFVAQWARTGKLNARIEETYTGHEVVRVFGRQAETQAAFDRENEELYESSFRAQFISGLIRPAMMFLGSANYVAIAVIGGLRVASGSMSLGEVQAFIQYTQHFTQPLAQLAAMANLIQSGVASAERVFELLDEPEERPDDVTARVDLGNGSPVRGKVTFEDISFRYQPDTPLIDDLSLTVEPGQTVAIVGPTGAGKTTLVNLIMRFYELDAGRITLDGRDIARMPRHELRSGVGMVLQDTWLFGGTIRDNIAYGNPRATDEQIRAAARAAHVDAYVHSLPDGYDTVIDEEADNISAGEKQLITIARAFLADPALLILDEATSSVDTRTELLVQRAMAALRGDRTSFVIAHRLSTIRDADLILVMRDGAIVEKGNHTELLDRRGTYYELYQSQFTGPAVEA
ncbi:MAG TPA: ABC transporter ATP-binding protein [Jiangellaceae bacterium]